jgi:hypothetical protein
MKNQFRNIIAILFITAFVTSCSEDLNPVVKRLTSISINEGGKYTITYGSNGMVEEIQAFYSDDLNSDIITYTFDWSSDKRELTVTADRGDSDLIISTFYYLDVLVNGTLKTVVYKVIFDDEGDGGKLLLISYNSAPGESIPSIIEGLHYKMGDESEWGDATWTETTNKITLGYSTNSEVIEINFNNTVDAWWTKLPAEIPAVLFENEFHDQFYYPYFFALKEVTSIVNTYGVKDTPDYNGTFQYQYDSDGSVTSIKTNGSTLTFVWE